MAKYIMKKGLQIAPDKKSHHSLSSCSSRIYDLVPDCCENNFVRLYFVHIVTCPTQSRNVMLFMS